MKRFWAFGAMLLLLSILALGVYADEGEAAYVAVNVQEAAGAGDEQAPDAAVDNDTEEEGKVETEEKVEEKVEEDVKKTGASDPIPTVESGTVSGWENNEGYVSLRPTFDDKEGDDKLSVDLDAVLAQAETWTEQLLNLIYAYRNDIISFSGTLAFAVYAFLYKRKLVPSVDGLKTGVVGTMNGVIDKIQEAIHSFSGILTTQQIGWNKDIEDIAEHLKKYESILQETQKQQTAVLLLEQRLEQSDARNAVYCAAMRAQVEMIHQTLSSACLSDEQHAANHKAYLNMLAMLEEAEARVAAIENGEAVEEGVALLMSAESGTAGGDAV